MLISLILFCYGAVIGSFLNVVALRYNSGRSVGGRSRCFSCGAQLGASDLVPLFSYLFSHGRCRHCGSRISIQYPLVEGISGLLFVATYLTFGLSPLCAYYFIIFSLLLVILIYDIRHKIIPDGLVYTFIALSALSLVVRFDSLSFVTPSLLAIGAGPLLFAPFLFLWLVSRGRWIGLGDGKLSWGIGWLVGLSAGGTALLFAVWIGAAVSVSLVVGQQLLSQGGKRLTMKSEIPFAPFLIAGLLIVLFFHVNFFTRTLLPF